MQDYNGGQNRWNNTSVAGAYGRPRGRAGWPRANNRGYAGTNRGSMQYTPLRQPQTDQQQFAFGGLGVSNAFPRQNNYWNSQPQQQNPLGAIGANLIPQYQQMLQSRNFGPSNPRFGNQYRSQFANNARQVAPRLCWLPGHNKTWQANKSKNRFLTSPGRSGDGDNSKKASHCSQVLLKGQRNLPSPSKKLAFNSPPKAAAVSESKTAEKQPPSDSVLTERESSDSVTSEKNSLNPVTNKKGRSDSVTCQKKGSDSVTSTRKGSDSVTSERKGSDSMTSEKKGSNSVTSEKRKKLKEIDKRLDILSERLLQSSPRKTGNSPLKQASPRIVPPDVIFKSIAEPESSSNRTSSEPSYQDVKRLTAGYDSPRSPSPHQSSDLVTPYKDIVSSDEINNSPQIADVYDLTLADSTEVLPTEEEGVDSENKLSSSSNDECDSKEVIEIADKSVDNVISLDSSNDESDLEICSVILAPESENITELADNTNDECVIVDSCEHTAIEESECMIIDSSGTESDKDLIAEEKIKSPKYSQDNHNSVELLKYSQDKDSSVELLSDIDVELVSLDDLFGRARSENQPGSGPIAVSSPDNRQENIAVRDEVESTNTQVDVITDRAEVESIDSCANEHTSDIAEEFQENFDKQVTGISSEVSESSNIPAAERLDDNSDKDLTGSSSELTESRNVPHDVDENFDKELTGTGSEPTESRNVPTHDVDENFDKELTGTGSERREDAKDTAVRQDPENSKKTSETDPDTTEPKTNKECSNGESSSDRMDQEDPDEQSQDSQILSQESHSGAKFFNDSMFELSQQANLDASDNDSGDEDIFKESGLNKPNLRDTPSVSYKDAETAEEEFDALDPDNTDPEPPTVAAKPVVNIAEKYCLDNLLVEKQNRDEIVEKLNRLEDDEERIRSGLQIMHFNDAQGEEVYEEGQKVIASMEVRKQVIMKQHPGEEVFKPQLFGQIFTYPESLTLAACGFQATGSYIEKQLHSSSQEMVVEMLGQGLFQICLPNFTDPEPFLNWVLYLMSLHSSSLIKQKCYELLLSALEHTDWTPNIQNFLTVFVNYGANPHSLGFPESHIENLNRPNQNDAENQDVRQYNIENLDYVINFISETVRSRFMNFSSDEIISLVNMVAFVSLDCRLTAGDILYHMQVCMSVLLNAIEENEWLLAVKAICVHLAGISQHHHNKVHLIRIFPGVPRGVQLSRALALVMLRQLLNREERVTQEQIPNVNKVQDVLEALRDFKLKDLTEFYFVSSVTRLVDLCVGSENLKAAEKEDFQRLIERFGGLRSEIRESVNVLDRTVIKDMIARLTTKWRFMLQNMGTRQTTLHSWFQASLSDHQVEDDQDDDIPENDAAPDVNETDARYDVIRSEAAVTVDVTVEQGEEEPMDEK